MDYIAAAHYDSASTLTGTCSVPTGTADGDIMFAIMKRSVTTDPSSVPSGWNLIVRAGAAQSLSYWLYYRVASSEPASYDWTWAATARTGISIVTYRSGFNSSTPIDASNNAYYNTNDTTIRAGSITVAAANSPLLYFAAFSISTTQTTTTNPSAPSSGITWTEDLADKYDGNSRFLRSVYSGIWTGSGATGSSDVTASTSSADKQGFLISLVPSAAPSVNAKIVKTWVA